ncbi:hypothetical protein RCJ22_04915, partial [Vibrio sp. FNV 38]|nr:hypothetical protein [Vibrio sp. FNV 38]
VYFVLRGATPRDQRRSDLIKWLLGIYIAMAVLSSMLPVLSSLAGAALIGFGIYWFVRRRQQKMREEQNRQQQIYNDAHVYQEPSYEYRNAAQRPADRTKSSILPHKANRRLKIVRNFSNRYDLNLTPDQMDCIVNASYMSET